MSHINNFCCCWSLNSTSLLKKGHDWLHILLFISSHPLCFSLAKYWVVLFIAVWNLKFVYVICQIWILSLFYVQAHQDSHRWKTIQMWWMWEEFHSEVDSWLPRENTHRSDIYLFKAEHSNYVFRGRPIGLLDEKIILVDP